MTYASAVTQEELAGKWLDGEATERAASQEHFIDSCRMLGVATSNEADPTGTWYAFGKGASISTHVDATVVAPGYQTLPTGRAVEP